MPKGKSVWLVNQFAGTPESGWGERHFYLTKDLVSADQRVVIISSGNNHMFHKNEDLKGLFTYQVYEGVEFLWVWLPPYNPRNFTRFLAMFFFAAACLLLPFKMKTIGKPKAIMLSSMSIFPLPSLLFLKRLLRVPKFIFEVRDLWPLTPIHLMGISKNNPLIRMIGFLEKWAFKSADQIISLFEEAAPYINGISKEPTKFNWLPNGIAPSLLHPKEYDKPDCVKNLPKDKTIFCYTGTLGFANAMEPLFEALKSGEDFLRDAHFLIVGDGYLRPEFEASCQQLNNVTFTGKVSKKDVPLILKEVDVCFIAWHKSELYRYGVSANKYFDYLGLGKPVLSAQEGIKDPVVKAGAGLRVDNSSEAILDGIKTFLKMSKEERASLGKAGQDFIEKNHLYTKLGQKFQSIIDG